MESFLKEYIQQDIITTIKKEYTSQLDNSRWKYIIETEIDPFLSEYKLDFTHQLKKGKFSPARCTEIDEHRCQARVWDEGYGGQCSRGKKYGDFCGIHHGKDLWLGKITEPRPEHPIYRGPKNDKYEMKKWRS